MEATLQAARPIRGPHGGWQKQEIDALQQSVEAAERSGESLRSVFERMSRQLGRKPNSIRNFYYAQVRAAQGEDGARATPFETFSPEEVERLVEQVLTARAQGVSVRACVRQMADGDRTRMLRYQNKYRSTVRTRPEIVRRVMDRLNEQGRAFVSPYAQEAGGAELADEEAAAAASAAIPVSADAPAGSFYAFAGAAELAALKNRAQESGDAHIGQLFESLDYLLARALEKPADDGGAQRRADRLGARCDMLRIALDDEQKRFGKLKSEAGGMVTFLKEYVALPETERQSGLQAFCEQAAQRLSRVECALMDEP